MLNALNALSEDNSLLVMPPWINPWLILAIIGSIASHMVILYVPFLARTFGITPITPYEWGLVFIFSFPVILVDELLKMIGRFKNKRELEKRMRHQQLEKKIE